MSQQVTRHLVIDLNTGFAYGLKLDADGNCKGVQPLNTSLETITDSRVVRRFGPLMAGNANLSRDPEPLPYGRTTYAVELSEDGEAGKMFTIVWPSREDMKKGVAPLVAQKDMGDDLVKAGIAPRPRPAAADRNVDEDAALKEALKNIDKMIGLDSAKRDIRQNIALSRFSRAKQEMGLSTQTVSRHMVFSGNPGTGKTTFAREVAKVYHALGFISKPEVHEVKREDLVAGYVGQTALKTKEQIDKAKGGILFIDEAYALSRASGLDGGKDFGGEAIDTLVAAMENMRDDLIVIVAGYTEPMKRFIDANEGLKSRFTTYINFDDYNTKDLGKILDVMLQDRGYTMSDEARTTALGMIDEERIRAKKGFGNGRTVRNLVEKVEKEMALRLENGNLLGRDHKLSDEEYKKALTTITVEDVRKVSLNGLNVKPAKGIGLGNAEPAQNDNGDLPASTTPAGRAAGKSFKHG